MAEDQGGGLFAKSGKDSFNLFGHKVPIAAIAAVAALIGVVLFIRARQQGSQVSAGAVPAGANTGVNPVVDFGAAGGPDLSGALANISQQLTTLNHGVNGPTTPPSPVLRAIGASDNPLGFPQGFSGGQTPVFSTDPKHQGIIGYLAPGAPIQGAVASTGIAGDPGFLVSYGGVQGFVPGRYTGLS